MINLHERMLPTSAGIEPRPPGLHSDGASNWATEAFAVFEANVFFPQEHVIYQWKDTKEELHFSLALLLRDEIMKLSVKSPSDGTLSKYLSMLTSGWTFTSLWANSAHYKLIIFLLFFPENRLWHFMQIVS